MNPDVARGLPWQPGQTRLALRGRIVLRLTEAHGHVPHYGDVALRAAAAASRLDDGDVDRRIRRFSPAARVTRAFHAARHVSAAGKRHLGFDDDEEALGLSRTYRIQVAPDTSVLNLVTDLRESAGVEMCTPHYLAEAPFAWEGGALAAGAARGRPASHAAAADPVWGQRMVGAARALAIEPGDSALIIAIVDSGIALAHPELTGRYRPGADLVDLADGEMSRDVTLIGDYTGRDRTPQDEMGHGTACASIIGARGLHVPPGLAGRARLLPVRALAGALCADRATPTAIGGLPDIDAAVKCAVDLGARVLNLSFGTPATALRPEDPPPHIEVVRYALMRDCVLVAASGNSGNDVAYFPAALPGVLAVGAVGEAGAPSRFTTRGAHVALSAPGEHIRCAALDGYDDNSGTSFAAPFVTAAAALILACGARLGVAVSPFMARDLLVRAAAPFAPGADAAGCGAGVLDVPAALRAAQAAFSSESGSDSDSEAEVGASLASVPASAESARLGRRTQPTPNNRRAERHANRSM
jgi:subtilisin family serine protease